MLSPKRYGDSMVFGAWGASGTGRQQRLWQLYRERGVIRVEQGKGKKDRYTVLAERLVREVGPYYAVYAPADHRDHSPYPQRSPSARRHST